MLLVADTQAWHRVGSPSVRGVALFSLQPYLGQQDKRIATQLSAGEDSDSSADSYARAGVSRDWAGIG